jgi:ribose transport system permease protein
VKKSNTPSKPQNNRLEKTLRNIGPVYYALLILIIIGMVSQPTFSSVRNVRNIIISTTPWAIAAIGQTLTLLIAGIDLSIGSVISLTNTLAAFLMKTNPEQTLGIVLLCIISGIIIGFVNGIGVTKLRLNPFIFTLATGIAVQGITLAIMYQPGGLVTEKFLNISRASIGPIPIAFFYIIILYALGWYFLKKTPFGLSIYAVGGNEMAARLSGVRADRIKIAVYTISGFLASLSGLFIASRIGSGDPIVGDPISLDTITIAVLGGTSLFGGVGGLIGSLSGSFFIGILSTTLNLNNISPFLQWVIKGLILILALALDLWQKSTKRKAINPNGSGVSP